MPKHRYNSTREKKRIHMRVSVSDIEKRSVIALLIIILLMFAVTPLVIIHKKKNDSNSITGSSCSSDISLTQPSTTADTVNSVLSSSNSDILMTPSAPIPSLKPYVASIGKNISSYVGDKIESTVDRSFSELTNLKLHA